ncbi:MAG: ABATE domain-containing protein, partial [Trebonia sp.]
MALVNLLTEGEDRGRKYPPPQGAERAARLNALFRSAGSKTEVTGREAESFGPVAAGLRTVFEAITAGDIDDAARRVNDMLKTTGAHPLLERHDGEPWHIHFHATDETSLAEGWAAGCATG